MLVPLLILLGLVGWVVIRHKTVGVTPMDAPPSGTDAKVVNVGGINFVTAPSSYDQRALGDMTSTGFDSNGNRITSVPAAYDLNDPATAKRRLDALDRATKVADLAASRGQTADQYYQAHLQQQVAEGQAQQEVIAEKIGHAPTSPTEMYNAIATGGVAGPPAGVKAPPGQYWDVAQQKFVTMFF